jgi:hypothetical protein
MIAENVVVVRCHWNWWFRTFCPGRNDGLLFLGLRADSFTVFRTFGQRIVVVALVHSYFLDRILAIPRIQSHH